MHILVAGIAIAAALGLFVYWLFVLPTEFFSPIEFKDTSVSVSMTYPTYVAFGDEAEMALSVTNHGSKVFTGQITVIFKGNVGARPLPSGSTAIEIKDLVAGASSANRLRFAFAMDPGWFSEETIGTILQVSSTAAAVQALPGPEIGIASVPFLRTLINLITKLCNSRGRRRLALGGRPQAPVRVGGKVISAVESYLRDWLRVLYWVFFKPTALPNHVREIVPQRAAERVFVTEFMRICATHREQTGFFVEDGGQYGLDIVYGFTHINDAYSCNRGRIRERR